MMKKKIVNRSLEIRSAEFDNDTGDLIIEGHFTSFNFRYSIGYNWWTNNEEFEEIDPDAFDKANFNTCFFKYNHSDSKYVMASYESGTIEINIDKVQNKAFFKARLAPTQDAKDLYMLIQRRVINKMSWAFTVDKESYDRKEHVSRVLSVENVYDIAAVPLPACDETSVNVNARKKTPDEERFYKRYLEELELKKKKIRAKILISKNLN